jgi:hypothetical protein
MSHEPLAELAEALVNLDHPPRMLMAGSGNSEDVKNDWPWNESTVLNSTGTVLWRQRKIWPAGIKRDRAIQFGLSDPGEKEMILEKNAAGNEIVIADVDGLGRCVVLICQDLETRLISEELIQDFQPDWVFSPILDSEITEGRWAHQRCFALSGTSRARFIAVTSTALPRLDATEPPIFGLAVGPKDTAHSTSDSGHVIDDGSEEGRCYATASDASRTIQWGSAGWKKTTLS